MDNPLPVFFGMFCVMPLALIGLGFGLGMAYARRSVLGYRLRSPFERAGYASPAGGQADDWQP